MVSRITRLQIHLTRLVIFLVEECVIFRSVKCCLSGRQEALNTLSLIQNTVLNLELIGISKQCFVELYVVDDVISISKCQEVCNILLRHGKFAKSFLKSKCAIKVVVAIYTFLYIIQLVVLAEDIFCFSYSGINKLLDRSIDIFYIIVDVCINLFLCSIDSDELINTSQKFIRKNLLEETKFFSLHSYILQTLSIISIHSKSYLIHQITLECFVDFVPSSATLYISKGNSVA